MERFIFDGLDDLLVALRAGKEHVAYLVLQDRTVRGVDDTVGRFDLTAEHARRVLEPDDPDEEDDPPDVVDAAEVWLRRTAAEVAEDRGERRFRVRFMGPKGAAMVHSAQFVCRDTATRQTEDAPELVMPIADFSEVEHSPVTKSLHALGELYTRFGNLVIGAVGNLQRIHDDTTRQLHAQLQESRAQTDLLVGSILEARVAEVTVAGERQAVAEQSDARHTLARDAIQQIGEAARAMLMSQGLSAETTELLKLLQSSPSLQAALTDPAVRALMQQPGQLDQLAGLLRAVAAPKPQPTPEVPHDVR
jgi:hypothetical protein